jgi:NIMA (never in mitosis gene a)-related kinase
MKNVKLKEYSIAEKLGQGSYGSVYLVSKKEKSVSQNKFTNQNLSNINNKSKSGLYVLKQIPLFNMDKSEIESVKQEAKILALLDCKYIVKYVDSFIETKTLNIIMEYCDGGDLSKYIKLRKGKPMQESEIWNIFIRISLGLYYLHSKKIIHRDLKSLNIFLNKDNTVKLGDLGVAKMLSSSFANTFVGTPYYLSPEICEEKPYNEKSDMWSLGCLLYEMITFKHPFNATNQGALILKIIGGKFEPIVNNSISNDLKSFVNFLLEKNPKKRLSIEELFENSIFITKLMELGLYDEFNNLKSDDSGVKINKEKDKIVNLNIPTPTAIPISNSNSDKKYGFYNIIKPKINKLNLKDRDKSEVSLFDNNSNQNNLDKEKIAITKKESCEKKERKETIESKEVNNIKERKDSTPSNFNLYNPANKKQPMIIKQKLDAERIRSKKKSFIGNISSIIGNVNINQSNVSSNVSLVSEVMGIGFPSCKKISTSNIGFGMGVEKESYSDLGKIKRKEENIKESDTKTLEKKENKEKVSNDIGNNIPSSNSKPKDIETKRKKIKKKSTISSFVIDEESIVIKNDNQIILDKSKNNFRSKENIECEKITQVSVAPSKSKSEVRSKNISAKKNSKLNFNEESKFNNLGSNSNSNSNEGSNLNTNNNSLNNNSIKKKKFKKKISKVTEQPSNDINDISNANNLISNSNVGKIGEENINKTSFSNGNEEIILQTPKTKLKKGKKTIINVQIKEDQFEPDDIKYNLIEKDSLENTRNLDEDDGKNNKFINKKHTQNMNLNYYKEKYDVKYNSSKNIFTMNFDIFSIIKQEKKSNKNKDEEIYTNDITSKFKSSDLVVEKNSVNRPLKPIEHYIKINTKQEIEKKESDSNFSDRSINNSTENETIVTLYNKIYRDKANNSYNNAYYSSQVPYNDNLNNNSNKISSNKENFSLLKQVNEEVDYFDNEEDIKSNIKSILGQEKFIDLINYYHHNKYFSDVTDKCEKFITIRFKSFLSESDLDRLKQLFQTLIFKDIYFELHS